MGAAVDGLEFTLKAMRGQKARDAKNIADGLLQSAEIILKESQKYVPVDTGALKASGVCFVHGTGLNAVAYVQYNEKYAVWVHENLEAWHEPPTSAKYLSKAVTKMRGTITALMKRQILIGRKA